MTEHVTLPSLPPGREPDKELWQLIDGQLTGMISPEGLARLDQRLQTDRKARQMYRDQAQLHAFLTWRVRGVTESDVQERTTKLDRMPGSRNPRTLPAVKRWLSRPVGMVAVAALILAATVGSALLWARGPVVAQVTRSVGARWEGRSSVEYGTSLRAGEQLRLQAGAVEIQFVDGAEVILQGPATFRLEGRNKGRLDDGQLAARVPEKARGFSIDTPTTTVVDYGTEFGVIVKGNAPSLPASNVKSATAPSTEVHVFQGEVEVAAPAENKPQQVAKLTAGKAVAVDQSHHSKALAAALPEQFTRAVAPSGPLQVDLGVNGNVQEGWIGVDTLNQTPPPLKLASAFAAQGETITIKLGIIGATKEYASRYRGEIQHPLANLLEDFHMHRGKHPLAITFSNLAAGQYRLTSYHHDVFRFQDSREPTGVQPPQRLSATVRGATKFDVSGATNFSATNGNQPKTPAIGVVLFTADGGHDVTVEYAVVAGSGAPLNGFVLESESK
ncbi:MAG: FecR family protein [Planctomycetes bacterium]|nr:FecR family protein [Planctomycetota bacterium]